MKPAICAICGKSSSVIEGDWVKFEDYVSLSENKIGHPIGLEWFCCDHISSAKTVKNLAAEDGIKKLKKRFSVSEPLNIPQDNNESVVGRLVRIIKRTMKKPKK